MSYGILGVNLGVMGLGFTGVMAAGQEPSTKALAPFADLSIAPDALPDYPGGPIGLRRHNGSLLTPTPLPRPSEDNFLLINSGGDCRGYNCINYGAYQELEALGLRVFGSLNGFAGLTNPRPQIVELTGEMTHGLAHSGDLLLATGSRNRGPWDQIDGLTDGAPLLNFLTHAAPFLGGLLIVGGDGTLKLARRIYEDTELKRLVFGGASMDGDIPGMERSIGMESSLKYVIDAIRSLQRTSGSCNKIHIVQTMGGNSGRFPLEAALNANVRAVIIPELGCIDLRYIYRELFRSLLDNRGAILVIGESGEYKTLAGKKVSFSPQKGTNNSSAVEALSSTLKQEMNEIAAKLFENLQVDTRVTLLGHPQRQPELLAPTDLRQGMDIGRRMVRALHAGESGIVLPLHERDPALSLDEALSAESHRKARKRALKIWRDNFGAYYPEITRTLGP